MARLFLYGTLKSDGPMAQHMLDNGCVIEHPYAVMRGFQMIDMGRYPGIIQQASVVDFRQVGVCGEVWNVPDDIKRQIDQMEVGAGYQIRQGYATTYESFDQMTGQDVLTSSRGLSGAVSVNYYMVPSGEIATYTGSVPIERINQAFFTNDSGVFVQDGYYQELTLHNWKQGQFNRREDGRYTLGQPIERWFINTQAPTTSNGRNDSDSEVAFPSEPYEDEDDE